MNAAKKSDEQAISKDWKPIYRRWWFWVIEVPFVVIFVGALLRIPALNEKERTQEVVAQIHAQRLTLADVNGDNLPPQPDTAQVDATIEGVDANGNGIRDDVELAIFKKYPNSAKIRAAELQYAKALQMELMAFNSETLVAAMQEKGRGFGCIYDSVSKSAEKNTIISERKLEVEKLVFSTSERQRKIEDVFDKYMTSFTTLHGQDCDLNTAQLTN